MLAQQTLDLHLEPSCPPLHTLPGQSSNIAPVPYFGKHAQRTPFMHAVSVAVTHLFTFALLLSHLLFLPSCLPPASALSCIAWETIPTFQSLEAVLVPNIHIGRILFHKPQNCKSPAVLSPPPSTYICVCRIGCI